MVKAGEIGGILDGVLLRLADQLERDQDLRRKIRSAMTYPIVVLVLAILAASFMLIFIVPVFAKMFQDLGGRSLCRPGFACYLRHPDQHIRGARVRRDGARRGHVPAMEEDRERQEGVGTGRAQDTGQDRRRREEGNPRPLRAPSPP